MIVVVTVRRKNGLARVYLSDVRPPVDEEVEELGRPEVPLWTRDFRQSVRSQVTTILQDVVANLGKTSGPQVYRSGILAFFGSELRGEYWYGGWRLGPPPSGVNGGPIREQIVWCERLVPDTGDPMTTAVEFGAELERLALLLTVFWGHRVYRITSDQVWGMDLSENPVNGHLVNRMVQRGYDEPSPPATMPEPGALAPGGPTREIDRLDGRDQGVRAGGFEAPADTSELFDIFLKADEATATRLLEAAKAYHTGLFINQVTKTGTVAYLVVAAESLLESELPRCECCNQHRGITKAVLDLFFAELPCLESRRDFVTRLIGDAYQVRSKHFHDAQFVGGELEPWYAHEVLLPNRTKLLEMSLDLLPLVNGLLVAWLYRRATGKVWPRALLPLPKYEWGAFHMVSATIGSS